MNRTTGTTGTTGRTETSGASETSGVPRAPGAPGTAHESAPSAPRPGTPSGAPERSVAVVGAGPTGLLLAGDLAEAGVPVTLIEKRPAAISNLSRAFVLHARTLEQFDTRQAAAAPAESPGGAAGGGGVGSVSLADELVAKGRRLDSLRLFARLTIRLDTLPSRFNFLLVLPQYEVEAALRRRAVAAGVHFAHETEVTGLAQDADGVTLHVRGADGRRAVLRAAYAVGADGLRSAVRQAVGLPFPGRSVLRSVVLADVRLARPPKDVLTVSAVGDAFAFIAPFGDGYHRVIGWRRARNVPDTAPLDLDEVREITRLASGQDFGMHDARWMSRFHSDERQAPAYRVGRVFLAGDAAHVHTPAGGQGMNTGLQDAANLSWKLAAVLAGRAPEAVLDSYQAERHPVGRAVLRSSGGLVRFVMAGRPWTLAARAALTAFVGAVRPARAWLVGQITGIGYAYRAPRGSHPLTGRRVPDVRLAGGTRLHEALRGGRFVLIAPTGTATGDLPEHVVPMYWRSGRRTTVLVRPDGYAAWAADAPTPSALTAALTASGAHPGARGTAGSALTGGQPSTGGQPLTGG